MPKSTVWLLCLPLVLASCAAVGPATRQGDEPSPAGDQAPAPRAPSKKAPAAKAVIDEWPSQRERMASAIGELRGIMVRTGDDGSLHVDIPSAEGFPRDSDTLQPSLTAALDRIAPRLIEHPRTSVQVVGHTDSIGSELYNLRLSIRRAEAVMEYLRQQGVALARLSADGMGESEPIADNASPAERIKNRRVELVIRPLGR